MTRNDKHCHAIVEHSLRLVCALFTQVTRQIVRDTAQRIFENFENLGTHFYTYHPTPRTLCALPRVIPSFARKIAGHGVNRSAGKCHGSISLCRLGCGRLLGSAIGTSSCVIGIAMSVPIFGYRDPQLKVNKNGLNIYNLNKNKLLSGKFNFYFSFPCFKTNKNAEHCNK